MNFVQIISYSVLALAVCACGRRPADLLRSGQAPVYDFPMYVSSGAPGQIIKFNRDGTREVFITGLNDPRGMAADRYGNLYVAEQGANQLTKIKVASGEASVVATGLSQPSVVAVNSVGEVFVAQDGQQNVIRASDRKVFASYSAIASAIAFGVNDLFLVGILGSDQVIWGSGENAPTATVDDPVNIATDGTGRVYVAEGAAANARVLRYHQREPGTMTVVADSLNGPVGIAVDPVGNIYIVEQGAARIVLVAYDQKLYAWANSIIDPYYVVFTQY